MQKPNRKFLNLGKNKKLILSYEVFFKNSHQVLQKKYRLDLSDTKIIEDHFLEIIDINEIKISLKEVGFNCILIGDLLFRNIPFLELPFVDVIAVKV